MSKMISSPLTNIEIETYLNTLNCKYFKGVFSADNIPNLKPPFSIIVNLSKYNEIGSHFVTILADKKCICYIDTFGISCFINSIYQFLHSFELNIFYNISTIQNIQSQGCGYYCILFVLYYENIIKNPIQWNLKHTNLNDKLCLYYLKIHKKINI